MIAIRLHPANSVSSLLFAVTHGERWRKALLNRHPDLDLVEDVLVPVLAKLTPDEQRRLAHCVTKAWGPRTETARLQRLLPAAWEDR